MPGPPAGVLMQVEGPVTDRQLELLPRVLASGPWIVVVLIVLPMAFRTVADPDLWGHTRFGLDMLATHTLPRDDPYSFTQDIPWINHEWLSELVMGGAYRAAGPLGLVVLKAALVAAFFALMATAYAGASPLVAGSALFLAAWGTAYVTSTLRPQLWTLIGVALICRLLMTAPRPWWLVALPTLFLVWVNMHGGWIVGAGLLVVWTSVQICRRGAPRALIASVAVLSALATLVNPYGWQMWAFLATTVRMSRDIAEWRPLLSLPALDWLPWLLAVIGVCVCAFSRPRPPIERIAMTAMLAYAALRVARTAPLCVVAAVLLMRPSVLASRFNVPLTFDPPSRSALRGLAVALLALAVISGVVMTRLARCIPIEGGWSPDLVAGQALIDAKVRGKMVTWFDWGEYALWHLGGGLRVSMDGRRETIYSDTVLEEHFALYEGTPEGVAYLQRLNPDYVWLPASKTRVRDWLAAHGYRMDVDTAHSFVAVRADRSNVFPRRETIDACFPGS
jgi:hypothetical protein